MCFALHKQHSVIKVLVLMPADQMHVRKDCKQKQSTEMPVTEMPVNCRNFSSKMLSSSRLYMYFSRLLLAAFRRYHVVLVLDPFMLVVSKYTAKHLQFVLYYVNF